MSKRKKAPPKNLGKKPMPETAAPREELRLAEIHSSLRHQAAALAEAADGDAESLADAGDGAQRAFETFAAIDERRSLATALRQAATAASLRAVDLAFRAGALDATARALDEVGSYLPENETDASGSEP